MYLYYTIWEIPFKFYSTIFHWFGEAVILTMYDTLIQRIIIQKTKQNIRHFNINGALDMQFRYVLCLIIKNYKLL